MINPLNARALGRDKCIELLGVNYCNIFKDKALLSYTEVNEGDEVMNVFVGIDEEDEELVGISTAHTGWKVFVSVEVSLVSGDVEVLDVKRSKLAYETDIFDDDN